MNAVSRMISDGKMGFCEAVMDGEATSPSMAELIELAVLHDTMLTKEMNAGLWRRLAFSCFMDCGTTVVQMPQRTLPTTMTLVTISTRPGSIIR